MPLSLEGINAVCWTFCGIAILLSAGRFWLRRKYLSRFYWDDYFHGLALLCLIALNCIYTGAIPILAGMTAFAEHKTKKLPDYRAYLQINVAHSVLAWTCMWSVKLAFLFYYYLLFNVSNKFVKAWWCVLAYTIITFWVQTAGTLVECGGSATNLLDKTVCFGAASESLKRKIFIFSYVVNVSSDIAIMALPMPILWSLEKISKSKKRAVSGLFFLTLFIIAVESLRLGEALVGLPNINVALWIELECAVAVIVSSLPSYALLWARGGQRTTKSYTVTANARLMASSKGSSHPTSWKPENQGKEDGSNAETKDGMIVEMGPVRPESP